MALTIQAAAKLALKHLRGIGFNPETNVVEEFINTDFRDPGQDSLGC